MLKQAAPAHAAPRGSMGTGAGWMLQMRGFAAETALQRWCRHPSRAGIDTMLRHSFTYLHPKLLLPSNPCRRTASSMEGCTGTSHRVPGMPLPPAPTAAWVTAKGLPRRAGEFERDPCPCPTAGDRGCVQHAQAQGGVRATGQRPGPVALPQMPPVMARWERVGGPDQPAHCPCHLPGQQGQVGTRAGRPEAPEPGNRHSRAPGLHPAGAATVRMHLPTFLGAACMPAEELSGV